MRVESLIKDASGAVEGFVAREIESGEELAVRAKVVVNATGPFSDSIRRLDQPEAPPIIAPSQGVHVVLDRSFLPGDSAIMVPHTDDGRVMFAIPWHDVTVVGTTDTPIDAIDLEPTPLAHEVEFIVETANRYLAADAQLSDIRSVFAGIRPLVKAGGGKDTASLSRDHTILIDPTSGLLTVAGGKWTTYRKMAQDIVDHAVTLGDLAPRPCVTEQLPIHGYHCNADRFGGLAHYGSDAPEIEHLDDTGDDAPIHNALTLTPAQVRWACRSEMARTVDDVLARRTRCLLFDARAADEVAPRVAEIMADELQQDTSWQAEQVQSFRQIARRYVPV